jgi:hypothetical protein
MKEEGMRTLKEERTKRLDEGRLPNVPKTFFLNPRPRLVEMQKPSS